MARTKGSLNKRNMTVAQIMNEKGFDPIGPLILMGQTPGHPKQFEACKELLTYIYPKLSAITMKAEVKTPGVTREAIDAIKMALAELND